MFSKNLAEMNNCFKSLEKELQLLAEKEPKLKLL